MEHVVCFTPSPANRNDDQGSANRRADPYLSARETIERSKEPRLRFGEDLKIKELNPAAEKLFGYSSFEAAGMDARLLLGIWGPNLLPALNAAVRHAGEYVATGFRCEATRENGSRLLAELDVSKRRIAGDGFYTVVVHEVPRTNAPTGIRTAPGPAATVAPLESAPPRPATRLDDFDERVRRTNEELQQLAYAASHDLQEPLRMVASYCELLERRYSQALDEKGRLVVSEAVKGASRMKDMVEGLLAYSRIRTRTSEPSEVRLNAALMEAVTRNRSAVLGTNASVVVDELPSVSGDAPQITDLLSHLLDNALKFRHPERTPRISVGADTDGAETVFSVEDNGLGIEERDYERVFALFQRLHPRDAYPGIGIGLALCRRIVGRHGGRIWVRSRPGEGSVFYFTLPFAPADPWCPSCG